MSRKILLVIIFLFILLSIKPTPVHAAKKRIRPSNKTSVGTYSFSKVTFLQSRLGVNINFFNLGQVSKTSYVLSYEGSGKAQGVVGSFAPNGTVDSRQILFGTCSSGACVYHTGIKDARLTITFTLKNGKSAVKRYILKV